MKEFTYKNINYRITTMDVFTAYDITRSYAPVLMTLSAMKKPTEGETPPPSNPESFARAMVALAGRVPKDINDLVIGTCLSTVKREVAGGAPWAAIWEPRSRRMMFDDIDVLGMNTIVWHVLEANLIPDFFSEPASTTGGNP